ncbi:MAG: YjcQ family protein [Lachnospiraceae bacterium]
MSKDDYHVIAYKILSYLYGCIKGKKTFSIDYFQCGTKTFPVEEEYWNYIIETLCEEGYITGVVLVAIIGQAAKGVKITSDIRITPKGIEYLQDNSMMKKAADFVKSAMQFL